jgi:hypothetical protein
MIINQKIKKNKGFVILFAVTLSSIILAIALGVANIAFKEVAFGTNARSTNDAFFAADTGVEFVLLNDKTPANYPAPALGANQSWNVVVSALGSMGQSCAKVVITKNTSLSSLTSTVIISKGYNIGDAACNSTNSNRIEREIKVSY